MPTRTRTPPTRAARRARRELIENIVLAEAETDYYAFAFADDDVLKQRLISFCVENIPWEMDCKDGVAAISILLQMGILKLGGEDGFDENNLRVSFDREHRTWTMMPDGADDDEVPIWEWDIDEDDGRIVRFDINGEFDDYGEPYYLPASIVRLERLVHLTVKNCGSLPVESLQKLPHLQQLIFITCDHASLFENFPPGVKLENLTRLSLYNCRVLSSSSPFFAWMAEQLPNLERLELWDIYVDPDDDDSASIDYIETLRGHDWSFGEQLKSLSIESSSVSSGNLDDDSFMTLFLDILPTKFPNVSSLVLGGNRIQSVQPIVERIKNGGTAAGGALRSAMRRLNVDDNPIMQKIKDGNLEERTAVVSLLETFNTIHYIGDFEEEDCPSDVEYALSINHAGRCLLEGDCIDRSIPPSLCPLILERANATGVHYLLQQGLVDRTEFGAGDAEKKKIPSKKRKRS